MSKLADNVLSFDAIHGQDRGGVRFDVEEVSRTEVAFQAGFFVASQVGDRNLGHVEVDDAVLNLAVGHFEFAARHSQGALVPVAGQLFSRPRDFGCHFGDGVEAVRQAGRSF